VARRSPAADRARGGEGIQAPRPSRARLTTGALSAATLAGIAAYTAAAGGPLASVGGTVAGAGALGLAGAVLVRFAPLLPWAIGFAGVGYVVGREHHRVVDGWAAVVGAALLLSAELAAWSIAHDRRIREERPVVVRQAVTLALLVAGSALVSFVLVGAAAVSASAGLALTAVGVAAAVGAVSVVLRLLRG
jgi:hypothetical protein